MFSEPAAKKQRCADQRQSIDSSPQAGDAAEASKPAEEAVTIIIEDSDEAIGSVEEAQAIDRLEEAAAVENAEEVQTAMLTRTQGIDHLTAEVNQRNEEARWWSEIATPKRKRELDSDDEPLNSSDDSSAYFRKKRRWFGRWKSIVRESVENI